MPRPVQITSPLPSELISDFGGDANTNLLPIQSYAGNYSPFAYNPPVSGRSNIVPINTPIIIGNSTANNLSLNRSLVIGSIANLSAATITLKGVDTFKNIVEETIAGPAAAGTVTSTKQYAILNYFSCSVATTDTNFTISMGLDLTTTFVPLDYFYPNSSYSVSGQVIGTGVDYSIYGTIQKPILFNNSGIPYMNPLMIWKPLDASVTNATTDIIYSFANMRTAVYLSATLTDNTSAISFTVAQQGLES